MSGRVYSLAPRQQPTRYPDKEVANRKARAALLGVVLNHIEDDRGDMIFVLSRWTLTRQLPSLEEVDIWLDRLGGRQ